jgi:hypothetical protein
MKVFRILGFQKSHSNRVMFGAAALCLAASSFAAIVANANADVGAGQPVAVFHSSGMGEILKMLDAKVDPEIIKAYVKNSQTAYSPNAAEIIALKEHGVSSDIIVAMLQRGGELRGQAAQAATMQPQMGTPPYRPGAAPAEQYGTEPAPPNYSDYPSYSYPDYSYAYPYYSGGYYGYGYGWPYYSYWPSFYCGFYPYWGWGHGYCGYYNHGHYYGHYYGHSVAVHNGSSVAVHNGSVHGSSTAVHVNTVGRSGSFATRSAMMTSGARMSSFSGRSGGFSSGGGGHSSSFSSHGGGGGGGFASHGGGGGRGR